MMHLIFHDSLVDRKFKRTAEIFCNIINVFTVTFDQFTVSFQKTRTDPKLHFVMNVEYVYLFDNFIS